jgi:hypothetical protein
LSVNGELGQTDGVGFRREVLRKIQFLLRSHLFPAVFSRFFDVSSTLVEANQELWGREWQDGEGLLCSHRGINPLTTDDGFFEA